MSMQWCNACDVFIDLDFKECEHMFQEEMKGGKENDNKNN